MYLTNGVFLYRVVDVVLTDSGEMADIEDCYWLDVVRIPICDLLARGLRVVNAGLTSSVGKRVDDAPAESPLEIAVDV